MTPCYSNYLCWVIMKPYQREKFGKDPRHVHIKTNHEYIKGDLKRITGIKKSRFSLSTGIGITLCIVLSSAFSCSFCICLLQDHIQLWFNRFASRKLTTDRAFYFPFLPLHFSFQMVADWQTETHGYSFGQSALYPEMDSGHPDIHEPDLLPFHLRHTLFAPMVTNDGSKSGKTCRDINPQPSLYRSARNRE